MTASIRTSEPGDEELRNDYWSDVKDSALRFFSLPPQLLVVLILEFLNSFRGFGMRFVMYTYVTNEFHLSDEDAGLLLGAKGMLDVFFGLCGSILVDLIGVRRTSIAALSVAVVGRSLFAFGRTRSALYASTLFFSPLGEALLSTGLYRVALKKLTTPRTRPVAFAVSYATFNLAGATADVLIDAMRKRPDATIGGAVFTPTRLFLVVTLLAVIASLAVAVLFLRDLTVADADDPEDVVVPPDAASSRPMAPWLGGRGGRYKVFATTTADTASASMEGEGSGGAPDDGHRRGGGGAWAARAVRRTVRQVWDLLRCRNMWSVFIFGVASLFLSMQWAASEIVLPPFLERNYGEATPIFTVQSINLWGCLVMPPLVGLLTAKTENFRVILPGMWVMALSPLAVVRNPTVTGACLWQVGLTLGEVFWSPRVQSWTAMLAPTGKEGLFFALAQSRNLFVPLGDYVLGRLNAAYNPNCPDCRDQYGHFCSAAEAVSGDDAADGLYRCMSEEEACDKLPLIDTPETCPITCQECPGWEPHADVLWTSFLVVSIISPVLVWILLPLFRGRHRFNESFFGIFRCSVGRLLGICGIDEGVIAESKTYERVDSKGSSVTGSGGDFDDNPNIGDLELT